MQTTATRRRSAAVTLAGLALATGTAAVGTGPVTAAPPDRPDRIATDPGAAGQQGPVGHVLRLGPRPRTDVRPIVLDTSDDRFTRGVDNQGWWFATRQSNFDSNDNYFVGRGPTAHIPRLNDFFTFSLRTVDVKIAYAELVVRRGSSRGDDTETLGLFGVHTSARRINHNAGHSATIHHDLGAGPDFGTFRVPVGGSRNDVLRLPLSHRAVYAVNHRRGDWFSVGGRLLSLGAHPHDEWLFGHTSGQGVQRLVLYPAVPGGGG